MGNNKSLLLNNTIDITDKIHIYVPTVKEVLEDEQNYYNMVRMITANPKVYRVLLDDNNIDYSKLTEYDLFIIFFDILKELDTHLIFKNLDLINFKKSINNDTKEIAFVDAKNDIVIDKLIHFKIAEALRKINMLERDTTHSANEHNTKYQIENERRRLERHKNDEYKSVLEDIIFACVNNKDFKYNYTTVKKINIYLLNRSFKQINQSVNFDKLMNGVYFGTVNVKEIKDKSALNWMYTT